MMVEAKGIRGLGQGGFACAAKPGVQAFGGQPVALPDIQGTERRTIHGVPGDLQVTLEGWELLDFGGGVHGFASVNGRRHHKADAFQVSFIGFPDKVPLAQQQNFGHGVEGQDCYFYYEVAGYSKERDLPHGVGFAYFHGYVPVRGVQGLPAGM